ncbi:hypothetical protein GALMADRAFT_51782, partial [Galerina marginata CBS 339.88]
ATYIICSASRQALINAAAASTEMCASSVSYISSSHTTMSTRFTSARCNNVLSHFKFINCNTFSFTRDCSCTNSSYAYLNHLAAKSQMAFDITTGTFCNAPNTRSDSKVRGTDAGRNESSHYTQGGIDGYSDAKGLATSNPASAITSADSHEYLAEDNPLLVKRRNDIEYHPKQKQFYIP